jgi:hypothetical protein
MSAKHTPAPWVGHFRESHWSVWGDGRLIGTVATDDDVHLVLAAPQLLEACEAAQSILAEMSSADTCRYCGAQRVWTGDGTIPHPIYHQSNCVFSAISSALSAARSEAS